ncbi:MAG: hypothetical protein QM753_16605 [Thermomicrobiales bacterium]
MPAPFDRLVNRLATRHSSRRAVNSGMLALLIGGVLAGRTHGASASRRQDDACSLGCTDSTCGEVPPGCPIYPPDNIWNTAIAMLPVVAESDAYVASIGLDTSLHPDFGAGLYEGFPLGIPFVRVPADQPPVAVTFDVPEESDPGPYPIPPDAPIEGGSCGEGDRHVIVVQEGTCLLYELYDATHQPDGSWTAYAGARFDLSTNDLRPAEWTSADAAGMAILPGLIRYDEIAAGVIPHALRFTASATREDFVWPARHQAGSTTEATVPPMGQRFRLKADVDISGFSSVNQIILTALKTYGMLLADNGSDWFLSGAPDDRWDNDDLHALQEGIVGSDFEAVDCSSLMVDPDSGQASPA